MTERVCILLHLEEDFEEGYKKFGTSFMDEAEKVYDYLKDEKFDRVILVRWEDGRIGEEHLVSRLDELIDEVQDYAWGWEREEMEEQYPDGEGINWGHGGQHSEVVMLDDWIKSLKGKDVTLTGAFEDECIETFSIAMEHCGVEFKREEGLIVGSGSSYVFRRESEMTPDELKEMVEDYATDQYEIDIKTPDNETAKAKIVELIIKTDYAYLQDGIAMDAAHSSLFGFSSDDTICLREFNLLEIDDELLNETEPTEIDDVNLDEADPIRASFENGQFVVNEQDYPLLKLYQEVGVEDLPVYLDEVSVNPYEYVGLSWKDEGSYEKLRNAARRKLQAGISHEPESLSP